MNRIFISYRREDTQAHADHLRDLLSAHFGPQSVFLDRGSIEPGQDFEQAIEKSLRNCSVVIALIGKSWLNVGPTGQRRLDDATDWVRREIENALERGLLVVPMLVDGALLPSKDDLPVSLSPLCSRVMFHCSRDQILSEAVVPLIARVARYFRENQPRAFVTACPRCDREVQITSFQSSFECPACKSQVAVLQPLRELVSLVNYDTATRRDIVHRLQLASADMEHCNYQEAYRAFDDIQREFPAVWEAVLNKAICRFWLGREDLTHLDNVLGLLETANQLSESDPYVAKCRDGIAYNLAALAAGKERLGANVIWSLSVFELSRAIAPALPSREELLSRFCTECHVEIQARLLRQLDRQRRDFDPPTSELAALHSINEVDPDAERMRFFAALASYKLQQGQANERLLRQYEWTKSRLHELCGDAKHPTITFKRFGAPVWRV